MSHLLSLPPEIISDITVHLASRCKDLKALSLVSFTTRQLVLPSCSPMRAEIDKV
ncbi:hypothetical protein PILCRDRAFT_625503 [Piloderma croceum F 1598]|uniref:F-box domain-containing protein n=1 Tax=Piloderma croceum (strain F 1598) TaxID=765440 RepID=A0A0C3BIQ9_PILCF|nr:hypothetical protein PILCRDRAFT_625503 [Piloderma croceum F 1598]